MAYQGNGQGYPYPQQRVSHRYLPETAVPPIKENNS